MEGKDRGKRPNTRDRVRIGTIGGCRFGIEGKFKFAREPDIFSPQ